MSGSEQSGVLEDLAGATLTPAERCEQRLAVRGTIPAAWQDSNLQGFKLNDETRDLYTR